MHRFTLFLLPLLAACASPESGQASKREDTPLMSQTMEQRFAASRKRMGDPNYRSRFDPGVQSTLARSKGSGSKLTAQKYQSNAFSGSKAYTQTPDYKAPLFSSRDKKSRMGSQDFAGRDEVAPVADDTFAAGQSRLADQTARQAGQTFREAGETFTTRANRDALRSQQKNDRPQFIELEDHKKNPAYNEEQVRRLLGR